MNEKKLGYGKNPGNQTALVLSLVFIAVWTVLTSTFIAKKRPDVYLPMLLVSAFYYFVVTKGLVPSWGACEITITDKRVFGSIAGRQIDYPLSSITAVELAQPYNLILHTASEKTTFYNIQNAPQLQSILRSLLTQGARPVQAAPSFNKFEEIKNLKALLDCGILTQEEFDRKKKQLLDL